MKNYKLDQTLLPEVWLTWMSKDGRIWMNKGGVRQNHAEWWMDYPGEYDFGRRRSNNGKVPFGNTYVTRNEDRIWVNAGSQPYRAYAKYHEDIDRLEVAMVVYDTTRGDHNHEWLFAGDRLFIGKDKSAMNQNGLTILNSITIKKSDVENSVTHALQAILRAEASEKFLQEFEKFLGCNYFIIGNGTAVDVEHPWHLTKWYTSKQKARSSGKSQKLVDGLVQFPLSDIDGLAYIYAPIFRDTTWRGDEYTSNIIYFERVNDEWSVLRGLIRNDDEEFDEVWRVYLGDDGTNRIATKTNGYWIPSSQPKGWYFRKAYYFANVDDAVEKCNRIKYIMPIYKEANSVDYLFTILRFPIIEQLYKLGHKQMALRIARSNTPMSDIKEMFGEYYKEKEKSILRQIGMTKHQLDSYYDIYASRRYNRGSVIKIMREALGSDLSHVDNDTYDEYLNAIDAMVGDFWGRTIVDQLNIDKSRFWKNVVRLGTKNRESYRLISDTLSEYKRLDNPKPEVDWIFDDYSDIVRTHDALMALRQEQEAAYRAYRNMAEADRLRLEDEKRKKVDEKRKHYEHEDDNFIIRLPKDVNEIVAEGSRQSICIGGYTTRHSKGETNLFFLRRKNDETTPFYAIEMRDNNIIQIHGFGNKWLGNNPEAIPTVVRWCRKHGIKCDTKILTCTAKGYGKTNEYIPMPQVD